MRGTRSRRVVGVGKLREFGLIVGQVRVIPSLSRDFSSNLDLPRTNIAR